jgi:hypothetical protein
MNLKKEGRCNHLCFSFPKQSQLIFFFFLICGKIYQCERIVSTIYEQRKYAIKYFSFHKNVMYT